MMVIYQRTNTATSVFYSVLSGLSEHCFPKTTCVMVVSGVHSVSCTGHCPLQLCIAASLPWAAGWRRDTWFHLWSPFARPPTRSSLKITNRSFWYAAPCLWNKQPTNLRKPCQIQSPSLTSITHGSSSSSPSSLSLLLSLLTRSVFILNLRLAARNALLIHLLPTSIATTSLDPACFQLIHCMCPKPIGLHVPPANVWLFGLSYVVSMDHPACSVIGLSTHHTLVSTVDGRW